MQMLVFLSILASLLPAILIVIYKRTVLVRKREALLNIVKDINRHTVPAVTGQPSMPVQSIALEAELEREYNTQFSGMRFYIPLIILIAFYLVGFAHILEMTLYTMGFQRPFAFFPLSYLRDMMPVMIAFTGTYLFNIGYLIRRLYVGDLSQSVVLAALNRLLLALGLARIVSLMLPQAGSLTELTVATYFSIGFLTNSYLKWVFTRGMRAMTGVNKEDVELTNINGITFWIDGRLEEEGVETVQHLATANPVSLALRTQYNLYTLVDWVDQAILLQRFGSQGMKVRDLCLFSGAIDLAWASPKNHGAPETPGLIASTINREQHFVELAMNTLFEDSSVRNIWALWQSRKDSAAGQTV